MIRRDIERQLNILEAQLMDVYSMSERKVREEHNVDSKEEAIEIIQDEIKMLEAQIDYCNDDDDLAGWCDPAFRTAADFFCMRL